MKQTSSVRILIDTDIGSDCDDAGALAVACALEARGDAQIIGCIYSSGKNPFGAGCVAAIQAYLQRADIPIGACHDFSFGDGRNFFSREIAEDRSYGHSIIRNEDAEEMVQTYRRVLSKQPDGSVTLVTIGHLKGLCELYATSADSHSPLSGEELVRNKIGRWVCMGGRFPESGEKADWNFGANGAHVYTRAAIEKFPNEIIFLDDMVARDVISGKNFKQTPESNPIRRCYEKFNQVNSPSETGRASWDPCAVHYAALGDCGLWELEGPGWCRVDDAGRVKWEANSVGKHSYLKKKVSREIIAAAIDELIYFDPHSA